MSEQETTVIQADPIRAKQIRQETECGLLEAHDAAMQEALLSAIERASSLDDLKPVLRTLVGGWAR